MLSDWIKKHYPQYWGFNTYPFDKVARVHKIKDEWGVFSNFAHTPIKVKTIEFDTTERLFQMVKFNSKEIQEEIYNKKGNPKMTAKHYQKVNPNNIRDEWGKIFIDVMKWCLELKYNQSEDFRKELERSKGLFIIEDQTSFPRKNADAWGVKLIDKEYVGPNLLGKLLMELRDNKVINTTFEHLILI